MNHKRKRPKNRRAGCLMCKPWKMTGARPKDKQKFSITKKLKAVEDECIKSV